MYKFLEPHFSDGQKAFFSDNKNMERLMDIHKEPLLIKMMEENDKKLFPEYKKQLKKYERATAIHGIIDNHNKLMKQNSKDNKEIDKINKSISYFRDQIIIEENKKRNAEERIALLQSNIDEKEDTKRVLLDVSGNLTPTDLPREVARARFDLKQAESTYLENRYLLDANYTLKNEIKKQKEIMTSKTTTVVKETTTRTTVIKKDKSVVSIESKKTVSTIHTNDYITSDTEYNGDSDESITDSTVQRRHERWLRRSKRTHKRIYRMDENEALLKRGMKEKPLSFDPENIEAN
jgi:hypothetical protein